MVEQWSSEDKGLRFNLRDIRRIIWMLVERDGAALGDVAKILDVPVEDLQDLKERIPYSAFDFDTDNAVMRGELESFRRNPPK